MVKRISNWSLSRQLRTGAFLLITLVMALFLAITGYQTRNLMLDNVAESQQRQVSALAAQMNTAYSTILDNTEMLARTFAELYPEPLQFSASEKVTVGSYASPLVRHQGEQVNLNFSRVDQFARMTGGNATVFIRYGDDFLRVTTSLKNEQGQRAIGTLLGKKHPGYRQLMAGKPYLGEARLFGTDYMTKYSPVIGADGQVKAILYVGLPISKVMAALRENLLSLRIGDSGYLGLAYAGEDKNRGKLIAHRTGQGELLSQVYGGVMGDQVGALLSQPQGAVEYVEAGSERDARMVWQQTGSGNWVVFAVTYTDEFIGAVHNLLWLMAVFAIVATLILVVLLGLFLSRSLRPVRAMRDVMHRIGGGDLTYRFPGALSATSDNELDQLKLSVNGMLDQFSSVVSQVRSSGEEIAVVSEQVVAVSGEMQGVARSSSDETVQVSAAINQMAESVEEVSASTVSVSQDASETAELTILGGEVIEKVTRSVDLLEREFNQASAVIDQLQQDSEEIGKVVEVISSVAEQTNLLALNAAIEAARAGEQGRGFAVVADEVRTLAQRTQASTREIQQVVQKLQENSLRATEQMEGGVEQVQSCVAEVGEAGLVLNRIRDAANQLRQHLETVARATEEQSAAAGQISASSQTLEASARRTAQEAEGNATAGIQMAQQAQSLRDQVSRFQILA